MKTQLRVAIAADTHHGWPAEADAADVDAFITLGDLSSADVRSLCGAEKPVLGVYGNHCYRGYLNTDGAYDLARGIAGATTWGDSAIIGIEGCVRYKDNGDDISYTQQQYAEQLDQINAADIIITHCPPRGCNDHEDPAHQGIDALARLVRRCRPRLIVHGHTYPRPPLTEFEGAQVLYVHGWTETDLHL